MLDDAAVERALARVVDPDGRTLGTAFFVSLDLALTCDHVVPGRSIEIEQAGRRLRATHIADEAAVRIDIALIEVAGRTSTDVLMLDPHAPAAFPFWSKGFQYASTQLRDSYPIQGEIVGRTSITHGDYQLDGVLVLDHGEVDEGMSGAPIVAIDEGTAIGVVDARFWRPAQPAAFAIAMADVIRRVPRVEKLYQKQRRTVAQTGRVLNDVAARRACAAQRLKAVLRLQRAGRYLGDRDVPRQALEESLDEFVHGTARICAVVGVSGSGKTTALAGYATRRPEQPVVLLSASRLPPNDPTLEGMLHAELGERPEPIADALRSAGERMIVILDGWNEAPASVLQAAQAWLEGAVDWLEETDVRLIVSSRPEHWSIYSGLFPVRFFPRPAGPGEPRPSLVLGNFTAEEARQAGRAYGLDRTLLPERIRHPLMVRIFADVRQEEQAGLYDGVEAWIEFKCRAVAQRLVDIDPGVVRDGLEATIAAMVERHGHQLPLASFRSLFRHEPRIGTEIVRENVLEEVGQSVRFAFDDVAELLESERIDRAVLAEPDALGSALRDPSGPSVGSVAFAILRLEREPEALYEAAAGVLAEAALRPPGFWATLCFLDVLQGARDPVRLRTALARITDTEERDDTGLIIAALRTVAIPVAVSLGAAHRLARHLKSYGWRLKDWPRGPGVLYDAGRELWNLVEEAMAGSPRETLTELAAWLKDDTELADRDARVYDVGARLLHWWFDREPATVCELLADSPAHRAWTVLRGVASERPQLLLPSLVRWGGEGDPGRQRLAAALLGVVYASDAASRQTVIDLALALERSGEPGIAFTASQALTQFAETRAEAVPRFLERVQVAGLQTNTGYHLLPSLEHDWRSVLDAVEQLAESGGYVHASDALLGVASWEGPEEFYRRIVEILAGFPVHAIDYAYARVVEHLLSRRAAVSVPPGLLDLAARMIEVGEPSARLRLIYFSSAAPPRNRREAQVQRRVRDLLLAREDDSSNVHMLIDRWLTSLANAGAPASRREAVAELVALAARTDAAAPERPLIRAVVQRTELLATIRANWPPATPVPESLARVCAAVDCGASVREAAIAELYPGE